MPAPAASRRAPPTAPLPPTAPALAPGVDDSVYAPPSAAVAP
jgi:hypothetical protein